LNIMDYEKLKIEIDAIVKIAESVPENLQVKCFEILLRGYLISPSASHPDSTSDLGAREVASTNMPPNAELVMRQLRITEGQLSKILVMDGDEVHFAPEPNNEKKATRVVQWALLLALKNALTSDKKEFRVDPEALRKVCQEKDCFDGKNFWGTLKSKSNAPLFGGGPLKSQGESRVLAPKGKDALADLIRQMAGDES